MFYYSKGFTIIELIVVISVIAILATIVLFNVMQYIPLSQTAAVKGNMHQLATIATDYSSNNGDISNFCRSFGDESVGNSIASINTDFTFNCTDNGDRSSPVSINDAGGATMMAAMGASLDGDDSNPCAPGQWYAYTQGLNGINCWCVDSQGDAEATCGDINTCSCN